MRKVTFIARMPAAKTPGFSNTTSTAAPKLCLGFTAKTLKQVCCAAVLAVLPMTSAVAQDAQPSGAVYISGAERIEIGDRIRMQSQRISAMACMMDAGVNVDAHRTAIQEAITEVDALLAGMKDGDATLNLTVAEDDRRMLSAIRGVKLQWEHFRDALNLRLSDIELVGPDYVSRQNLNLMHASKFLVSETVNRYTIPPALLQSDAFTLQIAARQRSLAQQIAKESCALMTGNAVMGSSRRLQNATKRFDASFNALLNGFPAAGVSAPATDEIQERLSDMSADWLALLAQLVALDDQAGSAKAQDIYNALDHIMVQYDALVPLYIEESKSGL